MLVCLTDCQANPKNCKRSRSLHAEREKKEAGLLHVPQKSALDKVTARDVSHTDNFMHENQPELKDS